VYPDPSAAGVPLALELAADRIMVNAASPVPIATEYYVAPF
jgi:hypothetical protein